ncbi:MAG: hypothetical protein ABIH34_03400 [Nanoarchaeota archaeon]
MAYDYSGLAAAVGIDNGVPSEYFEAETFRFRLFGRYIKVGDGQEFVLFFMGKTHNNQVGNLEQAITPGTEGLLRKMKNPNSGVVQLVFPNHQIATNVLPGIIERYRETLASPGSGAQG